MLYSGGAFHESGVLYADVAAVDPHDSASTGMLALLAIREGRRADVGIHVEPDFDRVRDYGPFRDLMRPAPGRGR